MDAQVIVVGAGPVGLMLAAELRLGGATVTVLEQLAAPTTESRASTLHARTMELLDQRGLLATLGTPPREPMSHFGGLPLDLGEQPTRYPGQWKVPQATLEKLLAAWAAGLGADIRREHEVTAVTQGGGRVVVDVATPSGPVRMTAGYLVGCDGERGAVGRLAGFSYAGRDATRELLRCDVTGVDVPDRRFERFPNGLAISATRGGVTRVMVHEHGRRPPGTPTFADVVAALRRVSGDDISAGTPVWVNAFGDVSRQATRYRKGRVLLAGDAAHRQMPVGGQALNLGVQDAVNLGWKLAAEVAGRVPTGLLDTYHAERHPVGQRALRDIEAQTLLLLGGPEVDPLRGTIRELLELPAVRFRLASTIGGLDIRYGDGDGLVGTRLPTVDLITTAGSTTSAALLHAGRGVLLDLSDNRPRARRLTTIAADWPGRVNLVPAAAAPGSALDGLTTVLVRPDGHVAWTADGFADPGTALRRWFGTPRPAPRAARTA